jgi:hypothetical protein
MQADMNASDGMKADQLWIRKDMEEGGSNLTKIISLNFPG